MNYRIDTIDAEGEVMGALADAAMAVVAAA